MCLHTVYSCFQSIIAELNSCKKDHMTHKAENTYYVAIYQKFANPWPKAWSIFMNIQYVQKKKSIFCNCWEQGSIYIHQIKFVNNVPSSITLFTFVF